MLWCIESLDKVKLLAILKAFANLDKAESTYFEGLSSRKNIDACISWYSKTSFRNSVLSPCSFLGVLVHDW